MEQTVCMDKCGYFCAPRQINRKRTAQCMVVEKVSPSVEQTPWVGTPKGLKRVSGKTKFSFGENTGMQGVLGVPNTGVGQQTGANIFGYFTTSQLHKAVKAFLSS